MNLFDDWDPDIEDLKLERLADRRYKARLAAHPSCRDPDHPGCEECSDEDDGEDS